MWVYDLPSSEYKLHKRGNLVAHTKNLLTVHRNEPLAICSQPINQSSNPLMWLFTPLYNILPNRIQLTWLPMGQYRNCKVWLKRLGHKIDSDCCLYLKLFTLGSQAPFHSSRPWRSPNREELRVPANNQHHGSQSSWKLILQPLYWWQNHRNPEPEPHSLLLNSWHA